MESFVTRLACLSTLLALCGCQTTTAVLSDYCTSYQRIVASRKDTPETLRQVARENAKWRSVCGG
jgi:hypothetical protein